MKKSLRVKVYNKYNQHCAYCGVELEYKEMQVDHLKSKYYGGLDDIDNLMPSCRKCNNFKNVFSLEQFREEISLQVERADKYSVNFRTAERFGLIKRIDISVIFYFEGV